MKGKVLVGVQFACLIALIVLPRARGDGVRAWIARGLLLLAFAVLGIAFVNLRKAVTVFPEPRPEAPFVTVGIYRFVRHPMYLGVLLFGASEVVATWSPIALLLFAVLFVDLSVKHRYEDGLLAAKWPQAMEYQRTVGALLPRLPRR